jgi:hypothetical protein
MGWAWDDETYEAKKKFEDILMGGFLFGLGIALPALRSKPNSHPVTKVILQPIAHTCVSVTRGVLFAFGANSVFVGAMHGMLPASLLSSLTGNKCNNEKTKSFPFFK